MSDSLWLHGLQHTRLPCPSLSPRVCSNSCLWSHWCIQPSHPLQPSSPFAFNLSQHQGISNESTLHIGWPKYWSFSLSISPSNEYSGLISLRLTGLISLQSKGLPPLFLVLLDPHSSPEVVDGGDIRPGWQTRKLRSKGRSDLFKVISEYLVGDQELFPSFLTFFSSAPLIQLMSLRTARAELGFVRPEGFQRQFGAVRCVGGVHAGSPGCLWGKGNAGSHRTPKRFGTKMPPRSPFYPLLLKGESQMAPQCPESSSHVSWVNRMLCHNSHWLITYQNCCVTFGESLSFSGPQSPDLEYLEAWSLVCRK